MLKKLKKALSEEFKKRYEKMESRYLGLENRIYTTIENRLDVLESKFDELSALFREELHNRKEKNEDKLSEIDIDDDVDSLADKIEDIKGAINEKVNQTKKEVSKKAKKVKDKLTKNAKSTVEKVKQSTKKTKKKAKNTKSTSSSIKTKKDNLTLINGIGEKLAAQLSEESISSFKALSELSDEKLKSLNKKIRGFEARFKRYDWRKQAKDLM